MNEKVSEILGRIKELEKELEAEFEKKREELRYRFEKRRAYFDKDVLVSHRKLKRGLLQQLREANLGYIITAPVIYAMIFPLVAIHLSAWVYQTICFTVYGIPKVKLSDHLIMDREKLAYLNLFEKVNCAYCGYANGLLAYVSEVAGRTEQYWCPIKHAGSVLSTHSRYGHFLDYGDAEGYKKNLEKVSTDFDDLKK